MGIFDLKLLKSSIKPLEKKINKKSIKWASNISE